jgi:nucleotide-binding universal stress UspA family protein
MNWMIGTIVVPSDGSSAVDGQLVSARALARATDARIVVAHVTHRNVDGREAQALDPSTEMEARVRAQVDALRSVGVRAELAILAFEGDLAGVIAEDARQRDADLIVTRRSRGDEVPGAPAGDLSHRLMLLAACPVLVVPPGAIDQASS